MWGKRQRADDWDGDRGSSPEDRHDQRPDDRRGSGWWDEPGDWAASNGNRQGFGDQGFAEDGRFGSDGRQGFGDPSWGQQRRGDGPFGEPGFSEPGFSEQGYGESGYGEPGYSGPGYGQPGHGEPGLGAPRQDSRQDNWQGDPRRPMRDFPEGGFGQPGYGGRGGDGGAPDLSGPDFGGDFRGVDRREADHRDLDRRDFDRRDPDRRDSDRRDPDRREGGGGPWNDAGGWGQAEPDMSGPVFTPAGPAPSPAPGAIPASAASTSTRPYGRLSIFTLLDDRVAEFDQLAEEAAEGVRVHEPDTLVYVMHVVPKAPMQRIIYEIYRDHTAFESHQRQPHILQFEEGRRSCVLVTNIIDLRLKYAKVAPLQGITPPPAGPPQLPAAQSAPAPGARHRAGPAMDSGARWLDEPSGGRPADPDGDWAADRSFSGGERRSQEWGQPQYMGQRYRDN